MAYDRIAVFLKWSSGEIKRAFKARQQDYGGARQLKPASYGRSLDDGSMLAVYAPNKPRAWVGQLWVTDTASGSANDGTEDIAFGTIDELKLAWAATDLQMKSFEDADYWTCEWKGDWDTPLEFDPARRNAVVDMVLEGKS